MLSNVLGIQATSLAVLGMLCNILGMLDNVLGIQATSLAVLGMLCNILGMLCNVLGMLNNVLSRPWHALQPRRPTSKENPPTFCLISCEAKGVVYHQVSCDHRDALWYTTPFISQLI